MNSNNLIIGKVYKINHSRKGSFSAIIKSENEEWVTVEVFDGVAGAALEYNRREKGEELTVRKSFCRFIGL